MCLNHETVLPGHFLLQPFNFTILEFDDGSATGTNEVVVVAFVRDVVVLRLGTEMSCLGNPGFAEQVQGTIDGGQSQVGVLFLASWWYIASAVICSCLKNAVRINSR